MVIAAAAVRDETNLGETGAMYGLTRERIRQIRERGLRKLRHPIRAQRLMPYYADEA